MVLYAVVYCWYCIMVWIFILKILIMYRVPPDPFYIIFQTHIYSWYWDGNVSQRIIIIWDKWWRLISGTNILWYLIYKFVMLPLLIYILLKCLFFLFGIFIQVHPAKLHPKLGVNISILHIFQTIPQHKI